MNLLQIASLKKLVTTKVWQHIALHVPSEDATRYFLSKCDQTFTLQNVVFSQMPEKNFLPVLGQYGILCHLIPQLSMPLVQVNI